MGVSETQKEEFRIHGRLVLLQSIAQQYTDGKEYCPNIERVLGQISSSNYRVAVIGEFKRGKSSLLNALLGTSVLPTDILPTTGTVNRIIYGTTQDMMIYYKDGSLEHRDLSELQYYGTKLQENAESRLEAIKEIVVQYPSVFCKNSIELIDTPGLNDDERMTETTLGVLKDIDAAIVVISAKMPLSSTERNLIVKILSYHEIHDIIFVVTFIDAVSRRRKEQDRMVEYIRQRIINETMELAQQTYGQDAAIMDKANRLLKEPKLFAVSSTLAMEGFIRDDEEMLEESRFPVFKEELLGLLTAQQSTMIRRKYIEIDTYVRENLPLWYQNEIQRIEQLSKENTAQRKHVQEDFSGVRGHLEGLFLRADNTMDVTAIEEQARICVAHIKKGFIYHLCTLNGTAATDETIKRVVSEGTAEANELLHSLYSDITNRICSVCESAEQGLWEYRKKWCETNQESSFLMLPEKPVLQAQSLYPHDVALVEWDIMPYLEAQVTNTVSKLLADFNSRINNWRRNLFVLIKTDCENIQPTILAKLDEEKEALATARILIDANYQSHREQMKMP